MLQLLHWFYGLFVDITFGRTQNIRCCCSRINHVSKELGIKSNMQRIKIIITYKRSFIPLILTEYLKILKPSLKISSRLIVTSRSDLLNFFVENKKMSVVTIKLDIIYTALREGTTSNFSRLGVTSSALCSE